MRTNIVIDDELMARAKTKKEAVEQGLRTLLRLSEQAELRSLRGAIDWDGDLDAQRCDG